MTILRHAMSSTALAAALAGAETIGTTELKPEQEMDQ